MKIQVFKITNTFVHSQTVSLFNDFYGKHHGILGGLLYTLIIFEKNECDSISSWTTICHLTTVKLWATCDIKFLFISHWKKTPLNLGVNGTDGITCSDQDLLAAEENIF